MSPNPFFPMTYFAPIPWPRKMWNIKEPTKISLQEPETCMVVFFVDWCTSILIDFWSGEEVSDLLLYIDVDQ